MTIEYRQLVADDVEMRSEGDGMTFTGYAIRYNSRSEDMGFREIILPGAVSKSLKSRNEIKAFVNHNTDNVIGSTRAGTLRLDDEAKGLRTEIDLPDTTYGRDLSISVKRGDVSGMSFGFSVPQGGDVWSDDFRLRTISELRLHEVSPVTGFPAYRATSAAVRSLAFLAHRTHQDVDALADAFNALTGELTDDQANLLVEMVDRARAKPADAPIIEDAAGVPLSVLQKQLELLAIK